MSGDVDLVNHWIHEEKWQERFLFSWKGWMKLAKSFSTLFYTFTRGVSRGFFMFDSQA